MPTAGGWIAPGLVEDSGGDAQALLSAGATVVAVPPPDFAVVVGAPPLIVVGAPASVGAVESGSVVFVPASVVVVAPLAVETPSLSSSAAPLATPTTPTSASRAATAVNRVRKLAGIGVGSILPIVDGGLWAATTAAVRGWMQWFGRGLSKRKWTILKWTLLSIVVIGLAVIRTLPGPRPARTINDPAFERAAVKICEKEIPPLRAVKREEDTDDPLEKETAKKVDEVADKLETVVVRLQALEVRAADRAKVDAWFGAFADFIEAGHHYAEALRGGNESVYNEVDNEGVEPLKRIRDFGRANHLDACIP